MKNPQVHRHAKGTRFEVGTLSGTTARVALALVGKGNHAAALLAERALDEFSPVAVLFVGVAGALWPSIALGDAVVATHMYAYHGGTSEDDGIKARPRVWEIAHHLVRIGDRASLLSPRPPTMCMVRPVAAGEIAQDSQRHSMSISQSGG